MKKIVAIGGGEIGGAGFSVETGSIDQEIIRLSRKKNPRLLFIPTASGDSPGYVKDIENHFGKELGCKVDVLYLLKEKNSFEDYEEQVRLADIIYVGGGNTLRMMKVWRRMGVDKLLIGAYEVGKVMCGVSAGAICWFRYGNSDSWKSKDPTKPLIKVKGLDIVNTLLCPHYNTEKDRKAELKLMMQQTSGIAIALDNCCAIEIIDDNYRIVSSKLTANAHQTFWKKGKYFEKKLAKNMEYLPIRQLLEKSL